jgi:hypothetical protein
LLRFASFQYAPRQFGLAGLLSFFLACGIYLGIRTIAIRSFGDTYYDFRTQIWRLMATIVIGWAVLLVLYHCWGLKLAMAIHFTGPVACRAVAFLVLLVGAWVQPA